MDGNNDLEKLIALIPKSYMISPQLPCHCCCQNSDCTFLKDIFAAFEQLENELRAAAQIGQALLARHKKCVHGTERKHSEMFQKYTQLEIEKKALDEENAKTQETNRWLFNQLEDLNQSVGQSETYIKALEATLDSTRYEFKRLQTLAARTQDLESQLAMLEREQEKLQNTFGTTHELKQKAEQKWKTAERMLVDLQDQMLAIDRETKEERERHAELIAQMKRRRVMERELSLITGRSNRERTTLQNFKNNGGKNISRFVRDLLQENASLQSGILELRDLLICSNDETQMLREQLMEKEASSIYGSKIRASTLRAELNQRDKSVNRMVPSNFHIHHHYHAPLKRNQNQKVKKKGGIGGKNQLSPLRLPKHKHRRKITDSSTTSQMTLSEFIDPKTSCKNQWPEQASQISEIVSSSGPNSPLSFCVKNAVFDGLSDICSSGPTSPGSSVDHFSPVFELCNRSGLDFSGRRNPPDCDNLGRGIIYEERSDEHSPLLSQKILPKHISTSWEPTCSQGFENPSFHKPNISIPSIDIPSLKVRPSQISLTLSIASLQYPPKKTRIHPPSMISLRENITPSSSAVMAQPILTTPEDHQENTFKFLSSMLAKNVNLQNCSTHVINNTSSSKLSRWLKSVSKIRRSKDGLKRKKSPNALKATRAGSSNSHGFPSRPPGINQKGPVPGFSKKKSEPLPCQIFPIDVNYDALHEVLAEEINVMSLK
ncbi:hypothetical protein OnM2_022015 [Erysiphe neolycopersici]|uniref:Uncharacterized protein n=1 Tax=Erysiphe neolycopersici TaxID=212602 RepID=A0A420I2Q7_9PEZI|nr:hypothetical protein OnM2_022015 [Erysiphe neolycopersici]